MKKIARCAQCLLNRRPLRTIFTQVPGANGKHSFFYLRSCYCYCCFFVFGFFLLFFQSLCATHSVLFIRSLALIFCASIKSLFNLVGSTKERKQKICVFLFAVIFFLAHSHSLSQSHSAFLSHSKTHSL